MSTPLEHLLGETVDALSRLDAKRLERLASQAETVSLPISCSERKTVEVRALRNTLLELLRTTDENLRLLRGLQRTRVAGLGEASAPMYGGSPWEH